MYFRFALNITHLAELSCVRGTQLVFAVRNHRGGWQSFGANWPLKPSWRRNFQRKAGLLDEAEGLHRVVLFLQRRNVMGDASPSCLGNIEAVHDFVVAAR